MAPTRSSFRIVRATSSSQTQYAKIISAPKKGPVAIKKGLRASPDDQQKYELLQDASARFAALKDGLRHLEHQPCQTFQFEAGTPVSVRIAKACRSLRVDDTLLYPQLYLTSDVHKVVYCHVCDAEYSVTNWNKVKTRHSSSDDHLAQVSKLLRVDVNCLRNPYPCYVSSCSWTAAGEREDAQIKHYKTMHLGLTPDQPLPYHIKASLEVYKQAMRAALPEASDCVGYAVPSTLPIPSSASSPASPSYSSSPSIVSSASSTAPSTPVEYTFKMWSPASQTPSLTNNDLKLDVCHDDFEVGPYLTASESQSTMFPLLESGSSLHDATRSSGSPQYDLSTFPLPDDGSFEFSELTDGTLYQQQSVWNFSEPENAQANADNFDNMGYNFGFMQEFASNVASDLSWGIDLSLFPGSS